MSLTIPGYDTAWQKPDPRAMRKAGHRFAMRYLSYTPSKNVTLAEMRRLFAAGLGLGLVWESTAGRALGGHVAGVSDAYSAKRQCINLGLSNSVVYFAVDFDVTPAQKPAVAAYLHGAAVVLGKDRVGVYGGYWAVKYAAEHDACDWFWQTYAWSGGLVYVAKVIASKPRGRVKHPVTHIYQYRNGVQVAGGSVDLNRAQPVAGINYPGDRPPNPNSVKAHRQKVWRQHLARAKRDAKALAVRIQKLDRLTR